MLKKIIIEGLKESLIDFEDWYFDDLADHIIRKLKSSGIEDRIEEALKPYFFYRKAYWSNTGVADTKSVYDDKDIIISKILKPIVGDVK